MQSNVLRFNISRPPSRLSDENLAMQSVRTHPAGQADTALLTKLLEGRDAADREDMRADAQQFLEQGGGGVIRSFDGFITPIKAMDQWLSKHRTDLSAEAFFEFVQGQDGTGMSVEAFVKSAEYARDRTRLGDTFLAHVIAARQRHRMPGILARALRICGVLELFAAHEAHVLVPGTFKSALKALILLPDRLYPLPRPKDEEAIHRNRQFEESKAAFKVREEEAKKIAGKIAQHENAIGEILAGYQFDRQRDLLQARENEPLTAAEVDEGRRNEPKVIGPRPSQRETASILSNEAVDMLSAQTTQLLSSLRIDVTRLNTVETVGHLEKRLAGLARDLYVNNGDNGDPAFVMIGGALHSVDDFNGAGRVVERPSGESTACVMPDDCTPATPENPVADDQPLEPGPGDPAAIAVTVKELMLVEQTLQSYALGEIAHIENVLKGERKDRTHRRKETTEDVSFFETESVEETERDLQSTDRFELQMESSKVVSQDTSFGAGLSVSGKYGPTVEFAANSSFGRDTSRQESVGTATSFSREVTERAVSRIQERVLERRTRREQLEVEETSLHELNNIRGDDNIAGIYRWVDKIYRSQVVNYGLRTRLEIMVPSPADFLKFAMANNSAATANLEKPRKPGYCRPGTSTFVPLNAQNICAQNYMFWVTRYGAKGVKPPPPQMQIVGKSFDNKNISKGTDTVSDGEIRIPAGYKAQRAWIVDGGVSIGSDYTLDAYVGRRYLSDTPQHHNKALNGEDGDLPVSLLAHKMAAYVVNIEVECILGTEKYQEWQLATFDAIMVGYNERLADYEDRLSAIELEQGVAISGNNPLRNEQVMRDELKRAAISIISGQHFDRFSAMRKGVTPEGAPQFDLARAALEGPYIRFFEQAFEWEHIAHVFYPYFWGRKDEWSTTAMLDDTDPKFAEFLRAGAARVIVPVRPDFNDAVASFLANGWLLADGEDSGLPGGEDLSSLNGLPLLSILAETKARQGYDGTKGEGSIDVTQGSANVTGTDTNFIEDFFVGREIQILGVKYTITAVSTPEAITLDRPYEGATAGGVPYVLGVQYVGEPWQVRVPTSLVFLENGESSLPDFS